MKTIDKKFFVDSKCGEIPCNDNVSNDNDSNDKVSKDSYCNVKCKTHIKKEKGGITFCTDLENEDAKFSSSKKGRKNQCISSNKKIENNKIGIFHTKDASKTQKQRNLVVSPEEITEGDEKGLFKIYLDK